MFSCVFSEGQEKRLHPLTLRLFNPGGRKEIESILKTIGDREGKKFKEMNKQRILFVQHREAERKAR